MGTLQDTRLTLLIAEPSLNDAEMVLSILRNAGYAVRATRIEDEQQLQTALDEKVVDLLLCAPNLDNLSLEAAQRAIQRAAKDVVLLVLADQDSPEARREALEIGAADLIGKHDQAQLKHVVLREHRHLLDRRRLRRLEAALRETERRCYALLDSSRDPIAYVHEGMHIYANPAYLDYFGFTDPADIDGTPLLNLAVGDDQARLKTFLRDYQKGKVAEPEFELSMATAQGSTPVHMSFSKASIDGEPCTQILIRDALAPEAPVVAETPAAAQQPQLGTRADLVRALEKAIADSAESEGAHNHALLMVRLDNIAALQESVGIPIVDAAIEQYAETIAAEVGDDAMAARFSEDAFAILLTHHGVHDAIALGEAIRQRIEELVPQHQGRTVTTTCSVGVSMLGEGGGGAAGIVTATARAASQARAAGGNQVHLHSAGDADQAGADSLRRQLSAALEDDEFFLVFQPIASLKGIAGERYEARIRLREESGGVMEPVDFIDQAEQAGLMPAIDRWVVDNALSTLALRLASDKHNPDITLFLKLSGPTLRDTDRFLGFLKERLEQHGVDGRQLVFQLNEPIAVTQLNHAKDMFRGLKGLRCAMSLDHFGSGLNSAQLIKHLPADYLKLDPTLTNGLTEDEELQESVKQTIATAHSMNKQVIAGHLEDVSSLALLWQFDADFVQGYFLQEPAQEMNYDFKGMVI